MKRLLFIIPLFCFSAVLPQELPLRTQEQLENLAGNMEDELQDDDPWLQELEYFRKHPLNLNSATREDLQQMQILTSLQIENFIDYRELLGKLINIYELQAVPSWDIGTIRKLLPFIYAGPALGLKENFLSRFKGDHSFLFRNSRILELSGGFTSDSGNRYLGDPNHLLFRYRYQYKDLLYFGLVGDKDAGEQFFRGIQSKGFDFYSVHFFARRMGIIRALALGDYVVNLGQGLIQWHSLGFSKGVDAAGIRKQAPVLMPYRATGEYSFYRGAGMTLLKGRVEVTGFISRKKLGGNINDTLGTFSSFQTSGYNRTALELANRNRITDLTVGGSVGYKFRSFSINLNTIYHGFDRALQKKEIPYNRFALSGTRVLNTSVDHSYTFKNIHLFGESAIDKNRKFATVQGFILSVDPKVDLSFIYRNISKAYHSINASAFTESSSPVNEKGIYSGISLRPAYGWTINAYADVYQFPWPRYRMDAPAGGVDYLFHLIYQPSKKTEIYARWRSGSKPLNDVSEKNFSYPDLQSSRSLRIHFSSQVNAGFLFRSRVEIVWFGRGEEKEEGFLGYVEAARQFNRKLKCGGRFQYVETGSYDSRIYVYEPDVLYSFSIPAYYDKSLRCLLNLSYEFNKNISCWLRMARVVSPGKMVIGSGLDVLNANRKTEIKTQFLVQL